MNSTNYAKIGGQISKQNYTRSLLMASKSVWSRCNVARDKKPQIKSPKLKLHSCVCKLLTTNEDDCEGFSTITGVSHVFPKVSWVAPEHPAHNSWINGKDGSPAVQESKYTFSPICLLLTSLNKS